MELIIFITLFIIAISLVVFHNIFPYPNAMILVGGFSVLILGVLMIGYGISINGTPALAGAITQRFGVITTLFGLSLGAGVVI